MMLKLLGEGRGGVAGREKAGQNSPKIASGFHTFIFFVDIDENHFSLHFISSQ